MTQNFHGETWKPVNFDFEFSNDYRLEVSNFGKLKSFNKIFDGKILNGSMINGYRIVRLKFFRPRDPKTESLINSYKQQISKQMKKIKSLKLAEVSKEEIDEAITQLNEVKSKLSKKSKSDFEKRTIHYHSLVHKLVAQYFCKKPSDKHSVVAHLDFEKLNNKSTNLKWMTPEENFIHQQKSPWVAEARQRNYNQKANSKVAKLTVTKVMLLKKMLNQGKPIRTLVKQFKITDTQILRIKRGENWADIQAAN